jgi:hypothetical protein
VTRDALRQLPFTSKGGRVGRKVLIRTDAAGGTHEFVDWLHARKLSYSLRFTLPEGAVDRSPQLTTVAEFWNPAHRSRLGERGALDIAGVIAVEVDNSTVPHTG